MDIVQTKAPLAATPRRGRHGRTPRAHGLQTRGRTLLVALLWRCGLTQADFADWLGVSRVAVTFWINGRTRPNKTQQALLAGRARIPRGAWLTAEERATLRRQKRLLARTAGCAAAQRPRAPRSAS